MSIFHLSVKPISRSVGRSAVAAAAYRSGTLLEEMRSGETHDYTRKRDIVHGEIVAPAGAPSWAYDRAALWNGAEAAEKRKDARVARDYELAIPWELNREQGIELVRDFAEALVERYGVAVDFNVHMDDPRKWDGSEKGWQGYHAHVMATTRRLGPDGFGEKVAIELSDAKRKSLGLGSGAEEIQALREVWERLGNRHLERAGSAERLDRRTLQEQGIDREPTIHLGPYVTELERRGVASDLGNLNRDILAGRKPQAEQIRVGGRGSSYAQPEPALARDEGLPAGAVDEVELRRLAADRVTWVVRVIERAERREERRERALEVQAGRPWDVAKARAVKLLEQARALTKRLREALEPRRLSAWAQERVRRSWGSVTGAAGPARPLKARVEPTLEAAVPERTVESDASFVPQDNFARRRAEFKARREVERPRPVVDQAALGQMQPGQSLRDEASEIRRGWERAAEESHKAQEAERLRAEGAARQKALKEVALRRARELELQRRQEIRRQWGLGPDGQLDKSRDRDRGRGGPER